MSTITEAEFYSYFKDKKVLELTTDEAHQHYKEMLLQKGLDGDDIQNICLGKNIENDLVFDELIKDFDSAKIISYIAESGFVERLNKISYFIDTIHINPSFATQPKTGASKMLPDAHTLLRPITAYFKLEYAVLSYMLKK